MKFTARKSTRAVALSFGGLFLLLALFLVEEHLRGRFALDRWLAEMRTNGEEFTIAELVPAPVPPEKNGAGLFPGAGFTGNMVPTPLPAATRLVASGKAAPVVRYPAWATRRKGESFFNTNGVTALWRNNTAFGTATVQGRYVPMLVTSEDLAADIAGASNGFKQVFAALSFAQWDFGVGYEHGFANLIMPHLMDVRAPAAWMRAASLSALYETNHAASLEQLMGIAALSHVLTNEPLVISQLVRLAIHQIGVSAVWEALQADGWSDDQLAALQKAYGAPDAIAPMLRAVAMERAMSLQMMSRPDELHAHLKASGVLNLELDFSKIRFPESFEEIFNPVVDTVISLIPLFNRFIYLPAWEFAWKDHDTLQQLRAWKRTMERMRAHAAQPDPTQLTLTTDEVSPRFTGDGVKAPRRFYDRVRFLMSSTVDTADRMIRRVALAETGSALAVTAIALRRFELSRGKLPEALSELVPQYLATVPMDPCNGEPLRYRRETDHTFVLYSVGPNGWDDEGDDSTETLQSPPRFLNGRDILWPQAATPEQMLRAVER